MSEKVVKSKVEDKPQAKKKKVEHISYAVLVDKSDKFKGLKGELTDATKLSLTGITNFVINYEDPHLVDFFLKTCWKQSELYKETYDIDAVELQHGAPGRGNAAAYLDALIFGSIEREEDEDGLGVMSCVTDPQTGGRKRKSDGFVNRKEVATGKAKDKTLLIKNIDYCMDFFDEHPGEVDAKALAIFDNFRNPNVKSACRIVLVSNEKLKLPFTVRTVEILPVDEFEAEHIFRSFVSLYKRNKVQVSFSDAQQGQIVRKLCGLTYTEAGDAIGEAFSMSKMVDKKSGKDKIDTSLVVKKLREKINKNFMEKAVGLTHLTAKPWEDYICPESSNFTDDVAKILRDFGEVEELQKKSEALSDQDKDNTDCEDDIEAIQTRIPHVIVLYGKGGVGKSAFPIHFADLLKYDVWDFNIGASHSKWVGEGAERIREALKRIDKSSHIVVRIDEYDRAMGSTNASGQGMHEAHKQVEAEFMNWLQNSQEDNLFVKNNIFVVMTTNHKDNITGPLLRSGRADLVIDIDNFDEKSMEKTFRSAARRNYNRGIKMLGLGTQDKLEKAIGKLDLEKLSTLATAKHFTVRDVDILLLEMAAHDYYHKKGKKGIAWSTDNFIKVLECSSGSIKGESTCELKLGDRDVIEGKASDYDPQICFPFADECKGDDFDIDEFKNSPIFE